MVLRMAMPRHWPCSRRTQALLLMEISPSGQRRFLPAEGHEDEVKGCSRGPPLVTHVNVRA
jgi:hypothetical protein